VVEPHRLEARRLEHLGDEASHLLRFFSDTGQRAGSLVLGEHPLAQHRGVAPDDCERASQLVSGNIEELALEPFEPAAALGFELEIGDDRAVGHTGAEDACERHEHLGLAGVEGSRAMDHQHPDNRTVCQHRHSSPHRTRDHQT
jgi:hypothetical protein